MTDKQHEALRLADEQDTDCHLQGICQRSGYSIIGCKPDEHDLTTVYMAGRMDERKVQRTEPVAWMVYTLDGKSVFVTDNPADFTDQHRALPLYTQDDTALLLQALRALEKMLDDAKYERVTVMNWNGCVYAIAALRERLGEKT